MSELSLSAMAKPRPPDCAPHTDLIALGAVTRIQHHIAAGIVEARFVAPDFARFAQHPVLDDLFCDDGREMGGGGIQPRVLELELPLLVVCFCIRLETSIAIFYCDTIRVALDGR